MELFKNDPTRPLDLILLGRVAIDFNPAYDDLVQEEFKPLKDVFHFAKYVGGSPANIAVGISKLGMKAGFIAKVSDDQFGDFVTEYFDRRGIDVSHITRVRDGSKLGLTFTEMLSPNESSILMYRNEAADLKLSVDDVDEAYIRQAKALLISGTSLAASPSREAALKAVTLARKCGTKIIFDVDYRPYNWENLDTVSLYYAAVAREADLIMGSREEFDLTERLMAPGLSDPESAALWHGFHAETVVIKHGKQGSTAYTRDGGRYSVRPFPVEARKGFGGGDGYAAGFLYGLKQGFGMAECLEFGSAEASMMVRANDCSDSLPTAEEVRAFIREEKERYGEMVARA